MVTAPIRIHVNCEMMTIVLTCTRHTSSYLIKYKDNSAMKKHMKGKNAVTIKKAVGGH